MSVSLDLPDIDLPDVDTITGTCGECGTPLTCDGVTWSDAAGASTCPAAPELCEQLCWDAVGRSHLIDQPCGSCSGHGTVYGQHNPVATYVPRSTRQDGGR